MLNHCVLIGRLTRDPELSYTASGVARLRFTLAIDRPYGNQQGERQADFIGIVAWRNLAERGGKYLRKGLLAAVVGSLQVRSYENQDGQKRRISEIVADDIRFLEWPKSEETTQQPDPDAAMRSFTEPGDDLPW